NPLLIAIRPGSVGDAGAGRVFFVSTIGSVAGVLVPAFLLIPNVTNFRGLLLLGLLLAALTLAGALLAPGLTAAERRALAPPAARRLVPPRRALARGLALSAGADGGGAAAPRPRGADRPRRHRRPLCSGAGLSRQDAGRD